MPHTGAARIFIISIRYNYKPFHYFIKCPAKTPYHGAGLEKQKKAPREKEVRKPGRLTDSREDTFSDVQHG
jgi:hypothetical protein